MGACATMHAQQRESGVSLPLNEEDVATRYQFTGHTDGATSNTV